MGKRLLKCAACGKYTLNQECSCGGTAAKVEPPKYSPVDAYGEYRRKAKEAAWKSSGLI
jgi:H/ACA ribonucleoprotein complex subunit 3